MRRLDVLHFELPFAGSRILRDLLRREGLIIRREHVRTLMRRIGTTAVYRGQNHAAASRASGVPRSSPHAQRRPAEPRLGGGHYVHPDGAWFVYLAAVMDWASRKHPELTHLVDAHG
jgi:putative transposase